MMMNFYRNTSRYVKIATTWSYLKPVSRENINLELGVRFLVESRL